MSGFQFPPPPPPPPTNNTQQVTQNYQSGGSGHQRGRGRGRGGDRGDQRGGRGRGRGQYGSGQISHEAPLHHRNGNHTPQTNAGYAINGSYAPQLQSGYPSSNWNFGVQHQTQSYHEISMNAQAQQGHFSQQRHRDAQRKPLFSGPPRTFDGHKRKLDALRVNEPRKVAKNGPATAPSVPSFGTPVITSRAQENLRVQPQKKSLGLTPGDADPIYSSSESDNEDEDVDEEKLYKALGEGLTFEHNGSIMSLNNVAELAEWIQERKENFPASFRLSEKEEKKRRLGAERKRLLAEAKAALGDRIVRQRPQKLNRKGGERASQNAGRRTASPKPAQSRASSRRDVAASQESGTLGAGGAPQIQQEADLSSHITSVKEAVAELPKPDPTSTLPVDFLEAGVASARAEVDQVEKKLDETEEAIAPKPGEEEEDDSSSISSTSSSDSSSSDDEPPEISTTKLPPLANTKRNPCKFFSATGRCRDGDACRFKHELKPEAAKALKERRRDPYAPILDEPEKRSKLSIHQRLLEQEEDAEEKLALQVIKYLALKFAHALQRPVPVVHDLISDGQRTEILMEFVDGECLEEAWPSMDGDQKRSIAEQLKHIINIMRQADPNQLEIGALGGPARDLRQFTDYYGGPFSSETDFNEFVLDFLPTTPLPIRAAISNSFNNQNKITFTHGDLTPRNIIVKDGSIQALLDWEYSGWYPEYWEYVKFFDRPTNCRDWKDYATIIFEKQYPRQLLTFQALARCQRP